MKEYFFLESNLEGKYLLKIHHNYLPTIHQMQGSYNVLFARLANLPYAQYLRYCRDILGAELVGKNSLYVLPLFDNTAVVKEFIRTLNKRMDTIMEFHNMRYPREEKEKL